MKNFLRAKSISNGLVRLLDDFCSIHNLKSPFDPEIIKKDSISFEQWLNAVSFIQDQYSKGCFCMDVAKLIHPSYIGIHGYLNSSSINLMEVFKSFSKYVSLWFNFTPVQIEFNNQYTTLSWENSSYLKTGHFLEESRISEELITLIFISHFSQLVYPEKILIEKIDVMFSENKCCDFHFKYNINYNCERNKIYFNNKILKYKINSFDQYLNMLLKNQIEFIYSSTPAKDFFIEELNQNIIKAIKANKPNVPYVATQMGLSVRVLQNKLKYYETSFIDQLCFIRKNLAFKYLKNSDLSISQIANLLAYKEQPSFNRSFKLWTGLTPLEWRNQAMLQ